MPALVTNTVMRDADDKARLAMDVLDFAAALMQQRQPTARLYSPATIG
jgi:hypothetical protein